MYRTKPPPLPPLLPPLPFRLRPPLPRLPRLLLPPLPPPLINPDAKDDVFIGLLYDQMGGYENGRV